MGKSGQPHTQADRGGQRSKAGDADRGRAAGTQQDAESPSSGSGVASQQPPPITPEQSSGANASPIPGKDERRNRSI